MKNRIFVLCPMKCHTGGVELLFQLVDQLIRFDQDAHILFLGQESNYIPYDGYQEYQSECCYYSKIVFSENDIIVFPEVYTRYFNLFPKSKKYVYWESIDNYYLGLPPKIKDNILLNGLVRGLMFWEKNALKIVLGKEKRSGFKTINKCVSLNLVQSEYARLFLLAKGISPGKIVDLSDYLHPSFLEPFSFSKRMNIVIYNPKKGYRITEKIIHFNPDISFIKLENMTRKEEISLMRKAKVYIDFGNHPGKDRIPREAVSQGCCLITNTQGAAKNSKDIPIPNYLKFDISHLNLSKIRSTILDFFSNYNKEVLLFKDYRSEIFFEKEVFEEQVKKIFVD